MVSLNATKQEVQMPFRYIVDHRHKVIANRNKIIARGSEPIANHGRPAVFIASHSSHKYSPMHCREIFFLMAHIFERGGSADG